MSLSELFGEFPGNKQANRFHPFCKSQSEKWLSEPELKSIHGFYETS
jgi:hypothetical protein